MRVLEVGPVAPPSALARAVPLQPILEIFPTYPTLLIAKDLRLSVLGHLLHWLGLSLFF